MNEYKVSIIIPCYNAEKYVDRCMQSVVDQVYPIKHLEIICVNDASTDKTLDMLMAWEQKYPDNICVVDCDSNGRQGRARNIGLSYATGEWILYIDVDDWIEPDYVSKLVEAADKDCDIVCCKAGRDPAEELRYYSEDSRGSSHIRYINISSDEQRRELSVLASLSFSAYCKLIRRSFLLDNELYFPERLAYEDIFWGSLLPYYVHHIAFIDSVLYHYYINPDSTVLSDEVPYHVDMLTVNMMLWEEYSYRGLFEKYHDEIEYNFIYTCYLAFMKVLALRFKEPNYSLYKLLKLITSERIPDWKNNRYIQNGDIKELHRVLLESLDKDIDKIQFSGILKAIRTSGM